MYFNRTSLEADSEALLESSDTALQILPGDFTCEDWDNIPTITLSSENFERLLREIVKQKSDKTAAVEFILKHAFHNLEKARHKKNKMDSLMGDAEKEAASAEKSYENARLEFKTAKEELKNAARTDADFNLFQNEESGSPAYQQALDEYQKAKEQLELASHTKDQSCAALQAMRIRFNEALSDEEAADEISTDLLKEFLLCKV